MKKKTNTVKFNDQSFDLFDALAALDKKDYQYYDKLSIEQKRKCAVYIMCIWLTLIKGKQDVQRYYLQSVEYNANKYLFNEHIQKHPSLQWKMLCASSPGIGKQYRQWISNIDINISRLKSSAKVKDIKEYYSKLYPSASKNDIEEVAKVFVLEHNKKMFLAKRFPAMKISDIETLSQLITQEDIDEYEKEYGNQ